jgi:signal transduction histidine kinase
MKVNEDSKPNILIVDDRPENIIAIHAVLNSPNYTLVEARSGEEALKQLLDKDFALILMDVQMPGLSGFETAMLIKKRKRSECIPIIFITASVTEESASDEGYRIGGIDFIFKPFKPEALRAKVEFFASFYRANKKSQKQLELEKELHQVIEVVSHDLKNPLGSIKINHQLLSKTMESGDKEKVYDLLKKKLPVLNNATRSMQTLIEDLLDLAKFEGAQVALEKNPHSLNEIAEEVIEILLPYAESQGLKIINNLEKNLIAICDKERIKQVFANLISNAIKFSETGGQVIVDGKHSNSKIVVTVTDTGVGIDPKDMPHIFERYWQANPIGKKGSGLGLSITKWIIEAHKGKIWLESSLGKGSTFHFEIPEK